MKKRNKAAALKYETGYEAPIVSAGGVGQIADKIIETAEANGIPVIENSELAELLTNIDVGDSIPYELYEAVAQIIAYVTDIDRTR